MDRRKSRRVRLQSVEKPCHAGKTLPRLKNPGLTSEKTVPHSKIGVLIKWPSTVFLETMTVNLRKDLGSLVDVHLKKFTNRKETLHLSPSWPHSLVNCMELKVLVCIFWVLGNVSLTFGPVLFFPGKTCLFL
jgi:hypothetical protein